LSVPTRRPEGLNLQSADLLINYDLPWNPMKVEQRIGRIDRIGQEHQKVYVFNLCYAGSAEEIVYGRLLQRLAHAGLIVGAQRARRRPSEGGGRGLGEYPGLARRRRSLQLLRSMPVHHRDRSDV
jgi:hypothetical protein